MNYIDAHVHSLECGIMCGGEVNVEIEIVDKGLKDRGVEKAILMPINDISWQPVKAMNDYMADIVDRYENYVGFIDLDVSQAHYAGGIVKLENEIIKYHGKGLKGIKIHPQNLGIQPDDWRLWSVYRLAGELNIPVTIHCYPGSPPGLSNTSDPLAIEKVVRAFHKTKFLIAHFGGVKYFYDMPLLNHDNVYFETSGVMAILKKYIGYENIKNVFEEIGYDKIMFGSDYPVEDIDETIEILKDVIPEDEFENVMRGNILRFGEQFDWWQKDGTS